MKEMLKLELEALKFRRNNWDEFQNFTNGIAQGLSIEKSFEGKAYCYIEIYHKKIVLEEGDWIVKVGENELHTCKANKLQELIANLTEGGNK